MLPQARRVAPSEMGEVEGRPTRGWPITAAAVEASAFSNENIRYDFRLKETRIEVTINTGVRLVASWASMEDYDSDEAPPPGMYFVFPPDGNVIMPPRTAAQRLVPNVAVVPTLTPLDDRESYVGDQTLRLHMTGRKASRYFRNALWRLGEDDWRDFTSYVYERTPELANLFLHRAQGTQQDDFDLFYTEERTRHEREIGWWRRHPDLAAGTVSPMAAAWKRCGHPGRAGRISASGSAAQVGTDALRDDSADCSGDPQRGDPS